MSFDIVVVKPESAGRLLADINEVELANPLGSLTEIRANCAAVFSGLQWSTERLGLYTASEGYHVEFLIPAHDNPESLHLALRFGDSWNDTSRSAFDELVLVVFERFGWQSFAVSDNSSLILNRQT